MLVPVPEAPPAMSHKEIVEGLRLLPKRVKPGKATIREMIIEGRRY